MKVTFGARVRYRPDNRKVTGMGGLMVGGQAHSAAYMMTRKVFGMVLANAIRADSADPHLSPGRAYEVFRQGEISTFRKTLMDGGYANKRWAGRLEVSGAYEGKDSQGRPKSSPVTIEFGSKYNEGTPGDRPRQDVMKGAIRRFVRTHPRTDLGGRRLKR